MAIEIKGQQLRIRVQSPKKFKQFATQDVGITGRLSRVVGYSKKLGWQTQAWRINLNDYSGFPAVEKEITELNIPQGHKRKAISLARKWFKSEKQLKGGI